jgi:hypothetical protein
MTLREAFHTVSAIHEHAEAERVDDRIHQQHVHDAEAREQAVGEEERGQQRADGVQALEGGEEAGEFVRVGELLRREAGKRQEVREPQYREENRRRRHPQQERRFADDAIALLHLANETRRLVAGGAASSAAPIVPWHLAFRVTHQRPRQRERHAQRSSPDEQQVLGM